ncbi:hypothetical protein [Alkalicoccobacillus porphyridii]|uniref:Uncharacterized protein n=1 Tax=Alkalicoccobacillus porphyridii TaxID=2597270 RepID=A0A553ZW00_9BACI|nr:hypothetical protein [Alkalicoccobacillus porphyridii]TSB45651.1 hypothetical protein FN960_14250 [Alkalicoccobacillus porphyridii]
MPRQLISRKLILVNAYLFICFAILSLVMIGPFEWHFHALVGILLIIVGVNQLLKHHFQFFLTNWSKQILQYKQRKLGKSEWKKWDRHIFSIYGWFILGGLYLISAIIGGGNPFSTTPYPIFIGMVVVMALLINLYVVVDNNRLKRLIQTHQTN